MRPDVEFYLKMFYDNLYERMLMENKLKNDSILLSFLEVKSNVRYRLLESASILSNKLPALILANLSRDLLIRPSDELNKYTITAKGVWVIEQNNRDITKEKIIEYIDHKFFDVYLGNKTLTDREKVILFSMVSARTFSEKSPIDLKRDEYALDAWKRIIDKCYEKLHGMKLVKNMNQEKLYGKKGNEHIVSNLIRHTDSLPKKTKGIYKAAGKQKYYLDIYSKDVLSRESLIHILDLVFNSKKDFKIEDINQINNFCSEIAYEEAPYIYDMEKHIFSSPEYDDVIRRAVKESLLGGNT